MSFIKNTLKNTASMLIAVTIIWSAYAALSTVSWGDTLSATSWNELVNKFGDLGGATVKDYVDAAAGWWGWGFPTTLSLYVGSATLPFASTGCRNLIQNWFNDWRLPSIEEVQHFAQTIPGTTYTWTSSISDYSRVSVRLSDSKLRLSDWLSTLGYYCVR
jgi:hypothetical protein